MTVRFTQHGEIDKEGERERERERKREIGDTRTNDNRESRRRNMKVHEEYVLHKLCSIIHMGGIKTFFPSFIDTTTTQKI